MKWNGKDLTAQARIRRFTEEFGFFCDIRLRINSIDTEERCLVGVDVPPGLRGAIIFGVDYALSKLGHMHGWEATIDHFEHHAIDTTAEVVALATAQAILQTVGHEHLPSLDADRGLAVFPK